MITVAFDLGYASVKKWWGVFLQSQKRDLSSKS